jgi:hemolysin activation/secretion protein
VLGQDWQWRLLANAQLSADALVPGEQFGAGGGSSVRGFEERVLSTDSGVSANAELYTPNLCGGAWQCRALAFYDAAYGKRNHVLPGELVAATIASTGVGMRFAAGNYASVQVDAGHVLRGGALAASGGNKIHVRVGFAY